MMAINVAPVLSCTHMELDMSALRSPTAMLVTLPHLPSQYEFGKSVNQCLGISGFLLNVFILFSSFPTFVCQLAAKLQPCIRVFWCLLRLWSVKTFYFRMSGETNSSTSSISRTRSKDCNPQNMKYMHILNHRKSILPWSITRCIPGYHAFVNHSCDGRFLPPYHWWIPLCTQSTYVFAFLAIAITWVL